MFQAIIISEIYTMKGPVFPQVPLLNIVWNITLKRLAPEFVLLLSPG